MRFNFYLAVLVLPIVLFGQDLKVEPPFWWSDMPTNQLQLMVYGEDISSFQATVDHPAIKLDRQISGDSKNYKFLYLTTADIAPGMVDITFSKGKKTRTISYEFRSRDNPENRNQGFDSSDVIYLLMPDRFANGDERNDTIEGMLEPVNRTDPNGRHGGDIQGIKDNLGYIKDLGMTAVWLTPVFENDMTPEYGAYHGYAATDLYKIDRRYGSNDEFKAFVDYCHAEGVKVIMDMIHNHIGDQHWWMLDLPTSDWVHDIEKYGTTSYRGSVQSDPYASAYDLAKLERAWFVNEMPDLNQRNPLLADYLIQNTLWWIEYSGIDGIRMDTYVYPYKDYMARWAKEVLAAYPDFNIVGEAWVETVAHESYWQRDRSAENDGYNSFLPNVTDFQIQGAIRNAMTQEDGWTTGLMQIYLALSQDRLYSNPMENVIFLDNHDLERFFTQVGKKEDLFKMAYGFLMTTRGIPQVYYGTELMWANAPTEGDSRKRADMPGGWPSDERSVFEKSGRLTQEQSALEYVTQLTNWRKNTNVIHSGKLRHFVPNENMYIYFRYDDNDCVMVVMNRNDTTKTVSRSQIIEMIGRYEKATHVLDGSVLDITTDFQVPAKATSIYQLSK